MGNQSAGSFGKTGGTRTSRDGWVELAIVALGTAALVGLAVHTYYQRVLKETAYFTSNAREEILPLEATYGPRHFSRNVEEWCIRDFFKDRRGGTFVDVGANHYRDENNTFFLEDSLDWSGVAIDALEEFGAGYVKHRPKTKYAALFVSDEGGATIPFFVPEKNRLLGSADEKFAGKEGAAGVRREVPTATLNTVLEQAHIGKVDFLSMDIELAEPRALKGFDIDRYKPGLVCIEAHVEVRQQILDYFARHGYVVVGKYLRADTQNLYFAPIGFDSDTRQQPRSHP